jgi:outer membrane protein OmpA-like peptidoglycan-associated protein
MVLISTDAHQPMRCSAEALLLPVEEKRDNMHRIAITAVLMTVAAALYAQEPNPTQSAPQGMPGGSVPVFRVNVVARTTPAINYHHRQGSTYVDLRGTALMPEAKGKMHVESNTGATKLQIQTEKLAPPSTFGPEFLTYVVWAITPEGNAKNLGELVRKGNESAGIDAATDLQTFGVIVTAEPYWAVSQPSDAVVMENMIRQDTTGTIESIDAKYELLQRGQYTENVGASQLEPLTADIRVPLQLREAREAIAIARAQGADRYAADTFQKSLIDMQNAEGFYMSRHNEKELETEARQATQNAEDARIITIRKEREEALAAERKSAADAQASAEAKAQSESERAAQANADRQAAEQARAQAEAAKADADRMRNEALVARNQAVQEQQQAQAEANAARAAAAKAETDKQALRAQLLAQLNTIMQTTDSARGLIMNMSDVLFDFGKATLRPEAREKLAKVSGILLAYPTLKVRVEGNTDNVGSDEFNQTLSEKRADAVRDYLVSQSVNPDSLTAIGLGKTRPIASNDTAEGRQQNRRVEMVMSGDIIGTPVNPGPTAQITPPQQ